MPKFFFCRVIANYAGWIYVGKVHKTLPKTGCINTPDHIHDMYISIRGMECNVVSVYL